MSNELIPFVNPNKWNKGIILTKLSPAIYKIKTNFYLNKWPKGLRAYAMTQIRTKTKIKKMYSLQIQVPTLKTEKKQSQKTYNVVQIKMLWSSQQSIRSLSHVLCTPPPDSQPGNLRNSNNKCFLCIARVAQRTSKSSTAIPSLGESKAQSW